MAATTAAAQRHDDIHSAHSGLVLTGGGARGAYQAGALRALAEMTKAHALPFDILAGSSVGSINAAFLASRAEDFQGATTALAKLWTTITPRDVFRTDTSTLARTATAWLADLGLGGCIGTGRSRALLDTTPLRALLDVHLDMRAIARHIEHGRLHGLGVAATSYESGIAATFFDGAGSIAPWSRVTRVATRVKLNIDHILASSAIPIFFPAVLVDGEWFGDGSIRLSTPLSPAIRMGATRILAIAVRDTPTKSSPHPRVASCVGGASPAAPAMPYPTLAQAGGVLLSSFLLDALECDVERTLRINETLRFISPDLLARQTIPLRPVDVLLLRPSCDLGDLVLSTIDRFPTALRHLFRGLGASEVEGWDLLSYLAFDSAYTTRLFELGYADTHARADEISVFLSDSEPSLESVTAAI